MNTVHCSINCSSTVPYIVRSSRLEMFCKKLVRKNFAKFTGKHLCRSLLFHKVAGMRPATLTSPFSIQHQATASGNKIFWISFSTRTETYFSLSEKQQILSGGHDKITAARRSEHIFKRKYRIRFKIYAIVLGVYFDWV